MRWLVIWALSALPALAGGEKAGEFDYWVLSLSWSPNWCAREGDARGSEQCGDGLGHGWILHGLWPQYDQGYPSFCRTTHRAPSRSMTAEMADIMGTSGLAWHQWRKHGACSGLSAKDYYALSRLTYRSVERPEILRLVNDRLRLSAKVIEDAFLEVNPDWTADMLTVTCRDGFVQEVRLCLNRQIEPTVCGADVRRDCRIPNAIFDPIR